MLLLQSTYSSLAITFMIDNRIKSDLFTAVVQLLFKIFLKNS